VCRLTKKVLRTLIRVCGFEFIRYTPEQRHFLGLNPNLRYRDFLIQEALAFREGEINLAEARFLSALIRDLKDTGPIIEVGTLFGWSTRIMTCQKSEDRELVTVDNYSWNPLGLQPDIHFCITEKILSEAMQRFKVRQVRMDKDDFYTSYHGSAPALIFFDAIHTYQATKADILWAKHVNARVVCGHDYNKEKYPGVVEAVNEFGGPREVVETLWVL
jgi:hypothetical protein